MGIKYQKVDRRGQGWQSLANAIVEQAAVDIIYHTLNIDRLKEEERVAEEKWLAVPEELRKMTADERKETEAGRRANRLRAIWKNAENNVSDAEVNNATARCFLNSERLAMFTTLPSEVIWKQINKRIEYEKKENEEWD